MLAKPLRSALLAALLISLPAAGAGAQEVVAPATLDELFVKLAHLQQANVFVARQMSETQMRAAGVLRSVIDKGGVPDATQQEVVETFISNALTMATVTLSPVATQEVAVGESMRRLVRRNILLLEQVTPLVAENAALAEAFEQYSVLQLQTQDLAVALEAGWVRYGETIRTAQLAGMLEPGSFDPSDKSWSIEEPDVDLPAVVARAEPAITVPPVTPAAPAVQPDAFAALPDLPAVDAAEPERMSPSDDLDVATLADGSLRIGDWTVVETNGITSASAGNLDPATAPLIASIAIDCRPNGTLQYVIAAGEAYASYRVYANDIDYQTVQAQGSIVSGPQALKTSDTLRIAFEWSEASPDEQRPLTIAAADGTEVIAKFSTDGYLEARGRVLDACEPWTPADLAVETSLAQRQAPAPVAPATAEAEPESAAPVIAPVPRPRPSSRPLQIM